MTLSIDFPDTLLVPGDPQAFTEPEVWYYKKLDLIYKHQLSFTAGISSKTDCSKTVLNLTDESKLVTCNWCILYLAYSHFHYWKTDHSL